MRVNVSNCFSWCVGHHYMKSQSLEVVQPVAVIFKLFPADFWLLQEVWYQGHLPECAGCVATWWERMLRGMLQITIQLPPRLVVTVVIQMAELVDGGSHFPILIMVPNLPSSSLFHQPSSPIRPPFVYFSLTSDPLSPFTYFPPYTFLHPPFIPHSPPPVIWDFSASN